LADSHGALCSTCTFRCCIEALLQEFHNLWTSLEQFTCPFKDHFLSIRKRQVRLNVGRLKMPLGSFDSGLLCFSQGSRVFIVSSRFLF
jgi:hypothetical protein